MQTLTTTGHAVISVGKLRLRGAIAALAFATALVAACGNGPAADAAPADAAVRQSSFRVRADANVGLNEDAGWADTAGERGLVYADWPFRIRFELEHAANTGGVATFRLQVRRNGGAWTNVAAADFPYPDEIATPRVSIVSTTAYPRGAATTDLIRGSRLPFRAGTGVVLDSLTGAWSRARSHSEWEWPVVIRRFADSAVTNDDGDVFEFRMADTAAHTIDAGRAATVTLAVPPRLLGGTFVETPARLGPWQAANGALYFVMEPAETWNVLMMVRSIDRGASWREVDGANRPATDDLEGFATVQHGARIHMLHQTSDAVRYHVFHTADHATTPDTWSVRDELVARPGEPPTQVADLAVRSDGSAVAVYGDPHGIRFRIRSNDGKWGREVRVDGSALSGPHVVLGRGDVVYLAYSGSDGRGGRAVWARRIEADGTLTPAELMANGIGTRAEDVGAVLPLVYLPVVDCVAIIYRWASGELWERRSCGRKRPTAAVRVTDRRVVQSAVDSDQVGADAIGAGGEVHVLFIDEETRDIYHTRSHAPGRWSVPAPIVTGVSAQWVRGAPLERSDGVTVYGFVYDAGSDGGSGMNRYGEVPLGCAGNARPREHPAGSANGSPRCVRADN